MIYDLPIFCTIKLKYYVSMLPAIVLKAKLWYMYTPIIIARTGSPASSWEE